MQGRVYYEASRELDCTYGPVCLRGVSPSLTAAAAHKKLLWLPEETKVNKGYCTSSASHSFSFCLCCGEKKTRKGQLLPTSKEFDLLRPHILKKKLRISCRREWTSTTRTAAKKKRYVTHFFGGESPSCR